VHPVGDKGMERLAEVLKTNTSFTLLHLEGACLGALEIAKREVKKKTL